MSTQAALGAANALLTLVINSLVAYQQAQIVIERARVEGREVGEEELAEILSQSQAKTRDTLAALDNLAS